MMNVVNFGTSYQIHGEEVHTYTQLPVGTYNVNFSKNLGFYLTSRPNLYSNEEKIYGSHMAKVNKVFNSYNLTHKNFGVLLSGAKGIGKSLFARLLAEEALERDMPVIVANDYIPGIEDFLSSIEQEVMILFDEFDKNFRKIYNKSAASSDEVDMQAKMLSLFDGIDNGKKLFVITCNNTYDLNEFLINRPGRFHYHFKFQYPTTDEVREYMEDKLAPQYHSYISSILRFTQTVNTNYDYLRAIAFELNQGSDLNEALNDLNITRADDIRYDLFVQFDNGEVFSESMLMIDIFKPQPSRFNVYKGKRCVAIETYFNNFTFSDTNEIHICVDDDTEVEWDEDNYWFVKDDGERKDLFAADEALKVKSIVLKRSISNTDRYKVV